MRFGTFEQVLGYPPLLSLVVFFVSFYPVAADAHWPPFLFFPVFFVREGQAPPIVPRLTGPWTPQMRLVPRLVSQSGPRLFTAFPPFSVTFRLPLQAVPHLPPPPGGVGHSWNHRDRVVSGGCGPKESLSYRDAVASAPLISAACWIRAGCGRFLTSPFWGCHGQSGFPRWGPSLSSPPRGAALGDR